uniref:Uncharacterized protein n=1 Tax=Arundo donax TaxID=35708 RepID=A0A0A9EYW8_ARUDO
MTCHYLCMFVLSSSSRGVHHKSLTYADEQGGSGLSVISPSLQKSGCTSNCKNGKIKKVYAGLQICILV